MNATQYILANAELPFDIDSFDPDAQALLNHPDTAGGWMRFNNAETHEEQVAGLDDIAEWVRVSWRRVLPHLSARFPEA